MADMHHFVQKLIQGFPITKVIDFDLDKNDKAVDRLQYEIYIPRLCKYVATETRKFELSCGYRILSRILPDEPGRDLIDFFLSRLAISDNLHTKKLILNILVGVTIPSGTNLGTLEDIVSSDRPVLKPLALTIFGNVQNAEGEKFLLAILKQSENPFEIFKICGILKTMGTLYAIPILLARCEASNPYLNSNISSAVTSIGERLKLPDVLIQEINNPGFWKPKWQGSPENFVGFMTLFCVLAGIEKTLSGDQWDRIAQVFIEELDVDLAPFSNFKEVRLCATEDFFSGVGNVLENFQSQIFLQMALDGTGVSESNETIATTLYHKLMNDYLFTRLSRKFFLVYDKL